MPMHIAFGKLKLSEKPPYFGLGLLREYLRERFTQPWNNYF